VRPSDAPRRHVRSGAPSRRTRAQLSPTLHAPTANTYIVSVCAPTRSRLTSRAHLEESASRAAHAAQAGFLFNDASPRFAADYTNGTQMCLGLWAPHPQSVWAVNGINLTVVDDDEQDALGECVAFERTLGSFSFDTQVPALGPPALDPANLPSPTAAPARCAEFHL
jgi:hypothetical protein